jgi:adenosylcobinamide kinase/adenosylcobinamide-phosphate guanylyltransferase
MGNHRIALIGGGTRSGKSTFAVELALRLGTRRAFVATATESDDDMRARIGRHREERGSKFTTIEEPLALAERLRSLNDYDVVVVDCVTHWLSNLMLRDTPTDSILAAVDEVGTVLAERRFHVVLVTNEVGMSLHAPTALGRRFVDVTGWAHQRLARVADDLYLAVMGVVVPIRPAALPPFSGDAS